MSALTAVDEPATAITPTPVRFAETLTTGVPDAKPDDLFPIVTRFRASAWEHALKRAGILEQFIDIPEGLRKGFLCGLENFSLASTFIPENHYSSTADEEFVISKYSEEIRLG
jgi:hypothetical protein